jgi:hypothetical protein
VYEFKVSGLLYAFLFKPEYIHSRMATPVPLSRVYPTGLMALP